jgi:hypothetical protein
MSMWCQHLSRINDVARKRAPATKWRKTDLQIIKRNHAQLIADFINGIDPRRTSGPLNDYARGDIRAFPDCTNVGDNREMVRLQIAAAGDTKFHTLDNDVQEGGKV